MLAFEQWIRVREGGMPNEVEGKQEQMVVIEVKGKLYFQTAALQ